MLQCKNGKICIKIEKKHTKSSLTHVLYCLPEWMLRWWSYFISTGLSYVIHPEKKFYIPLVKLKNTYTNFYSLWKWERRTLNIYVDDECERNKVFSIFLWANLKWLILEGQQSDFMLIVAFLPSPYNQFKKLHLHVCTYEF